MSSGNAGLESHASVTVEHNNKLSDRQGTNKKDKNGGASVFSCVLGRFPLCAKPSTSRLYSARSLPASVALNLP